MLVPCFLFVSASVCTLLCVYALVVDLTADFSSPGPISPITPHPSLSEMGAARAFVRLLRLLLAGRSAARAQQGLDVSPETQEADGERISAISKVRYKCLGVVLRHNASSGVKPQRFYLERARVLIVSKRPHTTFQWCGESWLL